MFTLSSPIPSHFFPRKHVLPRLRYEHFDAVTKLPWLGKGTGSGTAPKETGRSRNGPHPTHGPDRG